MKEKLQQAVAQLAFARKERIDSRFRCLTRGLSQMPDRTRDSALFLLNQT